MKKSDKGRGIRDKGRGKRRAAVAVVAGAGSRRLYEAVMDSGLACVDPTLEEERMALCGPRYVHGGSQRPAFRAGRVTSSLVMGGRRVGISRPRVRTAAGHEMALPSSVVWSAQDRCASELRSVLPRNLRRWPSGRLHSCEYEPKKAIIRCTCAS
jgi:hypothetical protein